ncbi:MFS general substrate transporter [Rhizopus microsporus var. microsporus]|uniref:MFS general substrate transporter n=1 Tax=Rhizopus microsporus var. microsporus TaxID=86635 RepID=A0A1X0R4I4_RHIZD|nr:MFS general substrate transporter [Rhizopus microsporus var. microsporus]
MLCHKKKTLQDSSESIISSDDPQSDIKLIPEEKTTFAAWIVTVVCLLLNCSCAVMWMTASSVPSMLSEWMNISLTQLNWLSNVSAILTTLVSLLSPLAYDVLGIKLSLILCGILNAVGCWVRTISIMVLPEKRYAIFMTGQAIASLGGPLAYNIGAKFVSVWFAPKHRGIANTCLSVQIGMALGPLILPLVTPTLQEIPIMLLCVSAFATVVAIPTFFIPKKPSVPPCLSATVEREPFLVGLRHLSKNIRFWWLTLLASVTAGMTFSVSLLIIEALTPFGYSEQSSGLCAASVVLAGCIGGLTTGYWIGKTAQHLMLLKLFTPMSVFSYFLFIFNFIPNAFPIVLLTCIINGFFCYALFPIYFELAAEITYPVSESISSCIMWAAMTIALLIFSIAIDALRAGPDSVPPYNMNASMIFVVIAVAIGNLPCFWLKGDLNRLKADKADQNDCPVL